MATKKKKTAKPQKRKTNQKEEVQQRIDFDAKKPIKQKKEHTVLKSLAPYILMLLGLIFLICFFTVQVIGLEDGAGFVGYAIQYFWCGLFGVAAFLISIF